MNTDEFGLSEEQRLIRRNVAELLAHVLPAEEIRRLDAASEFPHAAFDALAEAGYMALPYDPAYGGMGRQPQGSRHPGRGTGAARQRRLLALPANRRLWRHAPAAHCRRASAAALPAGDLCGQAQVGVRIVRARHRSDASGIKTRAVRDGNGYRLSGQKLYISAAHVADYLMVVAKTDSEAKHKGVTLFWVDAHAPGVSMKPLETLGQRTTHPNEIFFDGVFMPADHVIGEEKRGWSELMKGLNLERLCLAAQACGNMHFAIEYAKAFAVDRKQFGQPISKFQAISTSSPTCA